MADFIPKQYKKEPITIRFSPAKLERVDQYARDYDLSRSEFINQCIDFALEHMPESESGDFHRLMKK
ncbi:ribbon-helix-helix domain-containing protein [Bacilliculturomica massiliensis]|uniref:ribbon-helix-helix domain-containing protein n=1 Tax=Bacilliculturomica massiliensis TaxID=1917867 RepID=UPI001030A07D|nr:CopG family transcriptional regulator [Bacilliculturomica massiliensis]